MKIRILDNSIRLRLSQSEVNELAKDYSVRRTVIFGPSKNLHYAVYSSDQEHIYATFEADEIKIFVPQSAIQPWATSDKISLSAEMPIEGQSPLKILIEKDFKCLTVRDGEDESDLFPNPTKEHLGC